MSFSYKFRTLRSGNFYESGTLEMSAHEEEVTGEVEADATEGDEENSVRFSPNLFDERIKASLEPLHAQISGLIEMKARLIQSYSARDISCFFFVKIEEFTIYIITYFENRRWTNQKTECRKLSCLNVQFIFIQITKIF